MFLLIDYANFIGPDERNGRLKEALQELVMVLADPLRAEQRGGRAELDEQRGTVQKITCRLYGGWFEREKVETPLATRLRHELSEDFRSAHEFPVSSEPDAQTVSLDVEVARSLYGDDTGVFSHTLRTKPITPVSEKGCTADLSTLGGVQGACLVNRFRDLIDADECTAPDCQSFSRNGLVRQEQKLVDSMMVVDLLRISALDEHDQTIGVVSADDDLWPGIRAALLWYTHVVQVLPRDRSGKTRELSREYAEFAHHPRFTSIPM